MLQIVLGALGLLFIGHWCFIVYEAFIFQKRSLALRSHGRRWKSEGQRPFLSVIVPARNEEASIGKCIGSLVGQTYPHLEIVAVNDRSTDRTGEILNQLSDKNPQVKVVSLSDLPAGWLGKNHALHQGFQVAQGEYILFTDGDIFFEPRALKETLSIMDYNDLDHIVLGPRFLSSGPVLGALQCYFSVLFLTAMRPSQIGKNKKYYIGAGAFNMVRRSAYLRMGGHKALALEVLDDVMLGKLMVVHGARQAVLDGQDLISLEWYKNVHGMVLGLEKNGFAALRFSIFRFLGLSLFQVYFCLLPYGVLGFGEGTPWVLFVFGTVFAHSIFTVAALKMGYRWWLTFFIPLAAWIFYWAHLRSTAYALWRREIIWRDTRYGLKTLKRHKVP